MRNAYSWRATAGFAVMAASLLCHITPFESVDEILTRQTGTVPHSPLGTEHRQFAERTGLPFEVTRGGAETLYPVYQLRVQELLREVAAAGNTN